MPFPISSVSHAAFFFVIVNFFPPPSLLLNYSNDSELILSCYKIKFASDRLNRKKNNKRFFAIVFENISAAGIFEGMVIFSSAANMMARNVSQKNECFVKKLPNYLMKIFNKTLGYLGKKNL